MGLSENAEPIRSNTPRSRLTTRLFSGSTVGSAIVGAGSTMVTDVRSGETWIERSSSWEKSTTASADPPATKTVRSPRTNEGTNRVSFSVSTITWKLPVAAWYSCRSASDWRSAG